MKNWRKTKDYRVWRVKVIRRDGSCRICGSRKKRHAHHLESGAFNPSLRFDVSNGVTLCKACHTNFHTNFKRSYRVKTTLYDFKNFQSLVKYLKDALCKK
jgi:5-methylcytosine-specific restriction endonuclease McrA